jgi:hypothetical protein
VKERFVVLATSPLFDSATSSLFDSPTWNNFIVIDRVEEDVIRVGGVVELRTL